MFIYLYLYACLKFVKLLFCMLMLLYMCVYFWEVICSTLMCVLFVLNYVNSEFFYNKNSIKPYYLIRWFCVFSSHHECSVCLLMYAPSDFFSFGEF